MIRARRLVAGLALAGALLGVSGCASSMDPIERLGRKAAGELRDLGDLPDPGNLRKAARNDPVRGAVLVPSPKRHTARNWHSA